MKQAMKLVSFMMALFLLIVSCSAPEAPADITHDLVSVTFQNLEAKTTTVSSGTVDNVAIASVYFQYKAENVSGLKQGEVTEWTNLSENPGLSTVIKLGRGIWHLSLRGFATAEARTAAGTADTANTTAIFAGEITDFSAGAGSADLTASADVPLKFTNATGTGTCEVTITFDEAYASVEGKKVNVRLQCGAFDETKRLTFGENGAGASDVANFENVNNGIATITVDYLDEDDTPYGDSGTATTLIMTDMTTKTSATISMDVVKLTVIGSRPSGTADDYFTPKVFNSIFDIYPDNIAFNAIVIGYAEETKALDQTPITYPYEIYTSAEKDAQGRYTASSLGLTPIVVTGRDSLNSSAATEVWYGKSVSYSTTPSTNTTLTTVRFVDGVTSIGAYAFNGCSGLTSITIPDSVTSIGFYAFSGCSGLTSITIPDGVTSIDNGTFSGCSSLMSITIPDSVTSIGDSAFKGCSGLTSITIPNSVTSIDAFAFSGCSGLTSATIGSGVTSIGGFAFSGCSGLTSITIPDGVTSIGSVFKGCSGLRSITIPNSVTTISGAFQDCSSLTAITLPDSVTSIGSSTFWNCSSLISITIPDSVTSIGTFAFNGCRGLTSITIPDSVTSIGFRAFDSCSNLTSITISNSVTSINDEVFYDCSSLISITIPDRVTSIGNYAFSGCRGLTSIIIPDSVTTIGEAAFRYCNNLTDIYVKQAENNTLFANVSVPDGCRITWNSTGPKSV